MQNGRAHGMGLGSLDLVTLAEARDKALLCRKLLLDGIDPLEARRQKRMQALLAAAATITFRDCAERYIAAHAKGWKNGKHRQQWRNTLETYAYPVIGELPVAAIDTGSGPAGHRADLDHEDRDGVPAARSPREHPRLGDGAQLPHGREPGPLARPSRQAAADALEGGAGQPP